MLKTLSENLRACRKMLCFLISITCYFLTVFVIYPFFKLRPYQGRRALKKVVSFYSKLFYFYMNIKIELSDPGGILKTKEHFLIVSNHLSYLDVLTICSIRPSLFVTSVEVKKTPFLGQICELGGSLFVDRRNKKNLGGEVSEMTNALLNSLDIVIFPESTSTDGSGVRKFKRPLYRAAFDSQTKVLPVTVNYTKINERDVDLKTRDQVCWYGDMTFLDHLWGVFKAKKIEASLTISSPLTPSDDIEISDFVDLSYQRVSENFRPFV